MINNAVILDEAKTSISDNEKFEFDQIISVNLTGVFLGTKHATQVMIPSKRIAFLHLEVLFLVLVVLLLMYTQV
ncbi:hypothetical protein ACSBR1_026095 [Camellia fascicularis]